MDVRLSTEDLTKQRGIPSLRPAGLSAQPPSGTAPTPIDELSADQRSALSGIAACVEMSHNIVGALADLPAQLLTCQEQNVTCVRALMRRYAVVEAADRIRGERTHRHQERLLERGSADRAAAMDVVCELLAAAVMAVDAALRLPMVADVRRIYLDLYASTLRQCRLVVRCSATPGDTGSCTDTVASDVAEQEHARPRVIEPGIDSQG